jgi:hypothetical protein
MISRAIAADGRKYRRLAAELREVSRDIANNAAGARADCHRIRSARMERFDDAGFAVNDDAADTGDCVCISCTHIA